MRGRARAAGPGLGVRVVTVALLFGFALIPVNPATIASTDHLLAKLPNGLCPAGSYLGAGNLCEPCKDGVDFTSSPNHLSSCLPCTVCKRDKEETSPCNVTRNTVCSCTPGTFEEKESPEICQKCQMCPTGTIETIPCTAKQNRKCAPKGSDYHYRGIIVPVIVVLLLLPWAAWKLPVIKRIITCIKTKYSGRDRNPENPVFYQRSEAQDNDCNEILNCSRSPGSEPEGERQDAVVEVPEQLPAEAERLLAPAAMEGSPPKRRKLIPVDGTDPIENIKRCFSASLDFVPYKSWDKFMREVGLTDNEIDLVKDETPNKNEVLYQMVVKWTNKRGRKASINTLLTALETVGERLARERIEEYMVSNGMFIYQEDETDSAVSLE